MTLDRQRLLAIFREELEDRRVELERGLLELEEATSDERRSQLLRDLFRSAHSLKGAALSVGEPRIAGVARELEDALGHLREVDAVVDRPLVQQLLDAVDRLGPAAVGDDGPDRRRSGAAGDRSGGDTPGPAPPPPTTPPRERARPEGTRVFAADLEAVIASTGELRLTVERAGTLLDDVAELVSVTRAVRSGWRELRPGVVLSDRGGASTARAPGLPELLEAGLARLETVTRKVDHHTVELERELVRSGEAVARDVQALGMVPFDETCVGLDRAVRDVAAAAGKQAGLRVVSGALELDRSVAAVLRDPLLHLVRNAVDHGVEDPAERTAAGKPPVGQVTVSAEVLAGVVRVAVTDDGAGIDPARIRAAAERIGVPAPSDEDETLRAVFTPGLSTSGRVTDVSGRGVGLDAVRGAVESVGGTVDISSTRGRGTEVVLSLPLTLSTMRAVLVVAGGQTVALPVTAVRRAVRVDPGDVVHVDGRPAVLLEDRSVALRDLAALLGFRSGPDTRTGTAMQAVIIDTTEGTVGLVVDELLEPREVTVRDLGPRLGNAPGVLGGLVLADGSCAFLLSPATWARQVLREPPVELWEATSGAVSSTAPRILLAEDSLTTRTLERSILEAAGYEVAVAVDGQDAWRLLQRHGADLVVSDVDMPNMDGFALCEAIRGSTRFASLPVVLVTSLADEGDRARGLEVGADAYFVKSSFEHTALLDTIARLL